MSRAIIPYGPQSPQTRRVQYGSQGFTPEIRPQQPFLSTIQPQSSPGLQGHPTLPIMRKSFEEDESEFEDEDDTNFIESLSTSTFCLLEVCLLLVVICIASIDKFAMNHSIQNSIACHMHILENGDVQQHDNVALEELEEAEEAARKARVDLTNARREQVMALGTKNIAVSENKKRNDHYRNMIKTAREKKNDIFRDILEMMGMCLTAVNTENVERESIDVANIQSLMTHSGYTNMDADMKCETSETSTQSSLNPICKVKQIMDIAEDYTLCVAAATLAAEDEQELAAAGAAVQVAIADRIFLEESRIS